MYKYEDFVKNDILTKAKALIDRGSYFMRDDGKLTYTKRLSAKSTWIHVRTKASNDCNFYHAVLFGVYKMIPLTCLNCWKVVVAPRTVSELFSRLEIQRVMHGTCKCGIEVREYVPRLYGGYFYNESLQEGLECWRKVRDAVSEKISPDVSVVLKRACTEFENYFGPSDKWKPCANQEKIERDINGLFVRDSYNHVQPDHLKNHVMRAWIQWAFSHGDKTYLEFTGGKPLQNGPVTYHCEDQDAPSSDNSGG